MPAKLILVYITCPDTEVAESIAQTLLNEKLIACANILPPSLSLYEWKGQTERTKENILLIKTQAHLWNQVLTRTLTLHPYETPCILQLNAEMANPAFAEWVQEQTEPKT